MGKFDSFINQYPLSKTLRFSLIPVGKTEENFNARLLLEEDRNRAAAYERVKGYIDRYHKVFIENVLSEFSFGDISEYTELYYKVGKETADVDKMKKLEDAMQSALSKAFNKDKEYKIIFGKEMVYEVLPHFLTEKEELEDVKMFDKFYTYFSGFNENRANMYKSGIKNSIAYRCVCENLPRFLDNAKNFNKIVEAIDDAKIEELKQTSLAVYGLDLSEIFTPSAFDSVLAQSGIDKYKGILGGYSCSDGTKVPGINELVNLYNQQVAKSDKSKRLPQLKPLYKQILSEGETISFIPESFSDDNEVISAVNTFYTEKIKENISNFVKLFADFETYDLSGIYVSAGAAVTDISNAVFGSWSAVSDAWNDEYATSKPMKKGKNADDYFEEQKKAYKRIESFSLAGLKELGSKRLSEGYTGDIAKYYTDTVKEKAEKISAAYAAAERLLTSEYDSERSKKLCKNNSAITLIKNLLDAIKDFERFVKPLCGTGKEENKDDLFYGDFVKYYEVISLLDRLYDKVRNYITKKPYSKDKVKLNFENPIFLEGWASALEIARSAQLFKTNDGKYYLGVIEKTQNAQFKEGYQSPIDENDEILKIFYEQMASPSKDIPNLMFVNGVAKKVNGRKDADGVNRRLEKSKADNLPPEVNAIRLRCGYSVNANNATREEITQFIDYYKQATEAYYSNFEFHFKDASEYASYADFVADADGQAYQINYRRISKKQLFDYVEKGYLYLFQIYNKDFSKHSHGISNLHTLYFKMLFDERNLADVVYQLNGGAEMFYREASINEKEKIVHPANIPLNMKSLGHEEEVRTFPYELVKDKRFTKRQFSLHLPITLNFKAPGKNFINNDVRLAVKNSEENYVIGIDRGERNLLYISVINSKGEIVKQKTLNEIVSPNGYKVDYHALLDKKEGDREKARKEWQTIENIKELKEGYLSQVIHEICRLVVKYDAIIAMEDLNFGFKNGRFKVEKQVYQKFENMLISKLNYLVDKNAEVDANGGLLRAYQLTNKVEGTNKGKQNGIIFYVPAYLTSKIDPTTGFVDLLKPKYSSIADSVEFINRFDDIRYEEKEEMFAFEFDYSKFPKGVSSYKKKWTLYTNGERIDTFRNLNKNNQWDQKPVTLTSEFKVLFDEYGVDYHKDIKSAITAINKKEFHSRFMHLLALVLQMRNSETGNVDVDYLISPVKNANGEFYDSRNCSDTLPKDADANGAYNIARKALWAINALKNSTEVDVSKVNLAIKNTEWLEFAQK